MCDAYCHLVPPPVAVRNLVSKSAPRDPIILLPYNDSASPLADDCARIGKAAANSPDLKNIKALDRKFALVWPVVLLWGRNTTAGKRGQRSCRQNGKDCQCPHCIVST
jgi:hypothetical protein